MLTPRNIVDAVAADLVTDHELAKKMGYAESSITYWMRTFKSFPKPVRVRPRLWYYPEVRNWLVDNGKVNEREI